MSFSGGEPVHSRSRKATPLGSRSNGKVACDSDKMLATTRYHHNPLFTSSPADNLIGTARTIERDFEIPCEDYKENCWTPDRIGSNAGEAKVKSLLARVCSKRVLGERNTFQERHQDYFDVDEPPKSIRALSFPSMEFQSSTDFGYSGEENSSSSLSTSPASEVSPPRFALSPPQETVSPTWSDSSVDSFEAAYDPKANLRTPRPKFLRYRPDWRLQFISSLELRESQTSADATQLFSSLQSESECIATAEHKLQFEDRSNAGIASSENLEKFPQSANITVEDEAKISNKIGEIGDCNVKSLHESIRETGTMETAFKESPVNSIAQSPDSIEAEKNQVSIEEVTGKEEEIKLDEKHVEDIDEDVLSSGAKIPRALIYALFLGILVPFSLMAAGSTGLLPQIAHGNALSSFWRGCRYSDALEAFEGLWSSDIDIGYAIVDSHFLHSMVEDLRGYVLEPMNSLMVSKKMNDYEHFDIEEWEWLPEYDITEYFRNQTQVLDGFWTDSEELDALLMAIIFGTEEDIQNRYLELMEFDEFGIGDFDYFPADLDDAPGFIEGATEVSTDDLNVASSALVLVGNNDLGQDSFHVADEEGRVAALASFDEGIDSSDENVMSAVQIAGSAPIERDSSCVESVIQDFDTQHGLSLVDGIKPREVIKDNSSFEEYLPSIARSVLTYGLAFLASVLLASPAYFSYRGSRKRRVVHKKKSRSSFQVSRLQEARATIASTAPDLVSTPEKDKTVEELLISPDCLKQSPYGSFTAYKRIVLNEGSEKEQVRLTPVRRSSRIRSHVQSPAVHQRVLLAS